MDPTTNDRIVLGMDTADLRAMIRERAYQLSEIRRNENVAGSPEDDWCQAAAEIDPYVIEIDA